MEHPDSKQVVITLVVELIGLFVLVVIHYVR